MVENIYGRKTHPQYRYHEKSFLQSNAFVHHRRVSGEPPNLRTIAETDDDLLGDGFLVPSDHRDLGATSTDRKQRAISLPTIYRDGSYLRINFPVKFNNEGAGRRRFSEPAVSWSSKFLPAIVPVCNDKKVTNDTASYFVQTPKISVADSEGEIPFEQKFQIEKRRHSDPLVYSSENIKKIESSGSDHQTNTRETSDDCASILSSNCSENICHEADKPEIKKSEVNSNSAAPTRRRKSSLVPIPFSVAKNCSSRRQKTPSKRRLSFPLSKNEEQLTKNLPEIHKYAWKAYDMDYESSSESLMPLDLMIDSIGEMDLEKQDNTAEKKHSCEEIITQWMKFFG